MAARLALVLCLLAPLALAGCLGTSSTERCVDRVSSATAGQAVIEADGGRFQYSDPNGLVNSNWEGRGVYVITVENAIITQTLKGFTHVRGCPILG